MNNSQINFRKLTKTDLPQLHEWLNKPMISEWFGNPPSVKEVEQKFIPYIEGTKPTYPFVIMCNDKDIGYIQTYMIQDYPDYANHLNLEAKAAGMDQFIGEEDYIHKGLGKVIMTKFLNEYVFILNDTDECILGPEPNNKAAIRAYEKVGFRHFDNVVVDGELEYLMRIYKGSI